jgi:hypothetical protein
MENIDQALSSLRLMESNGNYHKQQSVRVDGVMDRKVGAYGIMESRWSTLTSDLGYTGARWQDRKMQDIVAREKLERDYRTLGSWELAVVSFRYGMPMARGMMDNSLTEPRDIELAGYPKVASYMRDVRRYQKNEHPVEGKLPQSGIPEDRPNPTLKRSEDVIRRRLVSMRNAERGRKVKNGSNTGIEQVGDTGIPDPTQ